MDIKRRVINLTRKYGTSDPFKICQHLKIIVIFRDLGSIKGYSIKRLRKKLICINENLSDFSKKVVCAHELGHCLLHQLDDVNFLLKHTKMIKINNLEKEANEFAVQLLFDEETEIFTVNKKDKEIIEQLFNNR